MKAYPIIDMHMHTFQWNIYGEPPPPDLITGKRPAARSNTEAIEAYIAEMDRYNIVLTVGSGQLEMVEKMKARIPNRFMGGIEFPKYTSPINKRMEQFVKTGDKQSNEIWRTKGGNHWVCLSCSPC